MPHPAAGPSDTSDGHESRDRPEAAVRDHLANERTLLAWQRTALGVIAIGFLIDRFAFEGDSFTFAGSIAGIGVVVLGAIVSLVGAYRFMRTEREIDTQSYQPAVLAHLALTAAIVVASAILVALFVMSPD